MYYYLLVITNISNSMYLLFNNNRYKSNLDPHFSILVEECLNALYKAKWYGFFDFANFNVWEYDKYKVRF